MSRDLMQALSGIKAGIDKLAGQRDTARAALTRWHTAAAERYPLKFADGTCPAMNTGAVEATLDVIMRGASDTARAECHDLNDLFELQLRADQRAVKRWREAHPGKETTSPDRADLVVWLMGQLDEARAECERLMARQCEQCSLPLPRVECTRCHLVESRGAGVFTDERAAVAEVEK